MKRFRRWMTERHNASAWWRLLFLAVTSSFCVGVAYTLEHVFKMGDPWISVLLLADIVGASFFATWAVTARIDDSETI